MFVIKRYKFRLKVSCATNCYFTLMFLNIRFVVTTPIVRCSSSAHNSRLFVLSRVVLAKRRVFSRPTGKQTLRIMATERLVQYIVVRKDLMRDFGWPLGSVCLQVYV